MRAMTVYKRGMVSRILASDSLSSKDFWPIQATFATRVNAFHVASWNSIIVPFFYAKPPKFSPDFPAYINYGSLGTTVGHELTHGFDDEGRMYGIAGENLHCRVCR